MSPTPQLELIQLDDPAAAAQLAAKRLLEARSEGPQLPLGLATGRTMEPVYAALVSLIHAQPEADRRAVLRNWLSFNLDDYVGLSPADPRSFAAFMASRLVQPLGLVSERVRLPDALAPDPAAEARRYAAELARNGGIGLQLLGLGLNGHVGFNEPPCAADAPCRCVELSAMTRRQNAAAFGGDPLAVPHRAISLGMAEILAARRILLVVTGVAKAPVLRRLLTESPSAALPGSWLRQHPCVTVLADRAALTGA
ncbi:MULTISPECIES: 6-phosphogluconolactonase [Aphanothece]|uniref:6-phosphogluconolactonase n=1 Tax=Aphanothece TaxID=1121 RepID=UPI00398490D7